MADETKAGEKTAEQQEPKTEGAKNAEQQGAKTDGAKTEAQGSAKADKARAAAEARQAVPRTKGEPREDSGIPPEHPGVTGNDSKHAESAEVLNERAGRGKEDGSEPRPDVPEPKAAPLAPPASAPVEPAQPLSEPNRPNSTPLDPSGTGHLGLVNADGEALDPEDVFEDLGGPGTFLVAKERVMERHLIRGTTTPLTRLVFPKGARVNKAVAAAFIANSKALAPAESAALDED